MLYFTKIQYYFFQLLHSLCIHQYAIHNQRKNPSSWDIPLDWTKTVVSDSLIPLQDLNLSYSCLLCDSLQFTTVLFRSVAQGKRNNKVVDLLTTLSHSISINCRSIISNIDLGNGLGEGDRTVYICFSLSTPVL